VSLDLFKETVHVVAHHHDLALLFIMQETVKERLKKRQYVCLSPHRIKHWFCFWF